MDSFTNTSICVSVIKFTASYPCGTYLGDEYSLTTLCVEQISYGENNSAQYAIIKEGNLQYIFQCIKKYPMLALLTTFGKALYTAGHME